MYVRRDILLFSFNEIRVIKKDTPFALSNLLFTNVFYFNLKFPLEHKTRISEKRKYNTSITLRFIIIVDRILHEFKAFSKRKQGQTICLKFYSKIKFLSNYFA